MRREEAFTMWEVTMSLALILVWSFVVIPFVVNGHHQIRRLQETLHDYEQLQVEVLHVTREDTEGAKQRCHGVACLPTR